MRILPSWVRAWLGACLRASSPGLHATSSTSCDACQKNRYGLMVVPSTAMSAVRYSRVTSKPGRTTACTTSDHETCTKNAVPTYAKRESVSHFKYFAYSEYGMNNSASTDTTPKITM